MRTRRCVRYPPPPADTPRLGARRTSSKVAEILICSNEYLSLPVRRTDEEPLQKLTTELRGELDVKARAALLGMRVPSRRGLRSDFCNRTLSSRSCTRRARRRSSCSTRRCAPTAACACGALRADARTAACGPQLARQGAAVPEALQADFLHVLGLAPTLLDELLKLMMRPRPPFGKPARWVAN